MKKQKELKIEVCCEGIESALTAFEGGADRIELCNNILQGGTTPSMGMIRYLRSKTDKKIFILVRPRAGDFLYTDAEFEVICQDIKTAQQAGADGIVSGALKADGRIDTERTARMIELSHPLPFTFHRAFDVCRGPFAAMEELIRLGAKRILSSGQASTAVEGTCLLEKLVKRSNGRIIIMPGSGIRAHNIAELAEKTRAGEFHVSAKMLKESLMQYRKDGVPMSSLKANPDEYKILQTDAGILEAILKAVKNKQNKIMS